MDQIKLKNTVLKDDDVFVNESETEFFFLMPTILRFYSRGIYVINT